MKVYNTLTRKKEEFVPIEEGKVRMYVCGPTVYNLIHIGNARPMIVFDTVRRYFEYKGFEVNYVSNFTDVDDKIIQKAMEEEVNASDISEKYIQEVKKDMASLNVKPATVHPKATEEIQAMIDMILVLIEKDFAYEVNGTVYFKTRSFPSYGKLSKKNLDDLNAGIRVAVSEEKRDEMDFVLWKPKKEGEPAWDSPWGQGRPGWHLECSVMAKKYLGEQIDIHAGGEDLIFPHHENEIAQSEAASGKEFTKYWMHNGFLNIDNQKMSKSEGNFFTVRDITCQFSAEVLRFFMLSAHYRSPLNFSRDLMEASQTGLDRIKTAAANLDFHLQSCKAGKEISAAEAEQLKAAREYTVRFQQAMEDDFNTADAISVIFELVKFANSNVNEESGNAFTQYLYDEIRRLCDILGMEVSPSEEMLDTDIEMKIQDRQNARKNKDFALADAIRDELLERGIVLEDTREGVKWKRA